MRIALNALFPPLCVACGQHLAHAHDIMCAACLARVPRYEALLCSECGARTLSTIPPCHPEVPYTLVAVTSYASPEARALVKALKYEGIRGAADTLALITAAATHDIFAQECSVKNGWCVVPIPLHAKRERERGFNQSMLFAESLSHHRPFAGLPIVNALRRVRHTDTQTEKPDYKARAMNVSGCFEATHHAIVRGKNVLLMDDVTTSGATLNEAARTLKHAGAKRIIALVFAKA